MDLKVAIAHTMVFAVVYALILGIPLFGALVWESQLEQVLGSRWWVWLWFVGIGLATLALYANRYFQKRATDRMRAEERRYQGILLHFSKGMTLIKELDKLLELIVHLLTREVYVSHAAVYLWDERAKKFLAKASRQWGVKDPPVYTKEDVLMEYLGWNRRPFVVEELVMHARGQAGGQLWTVVESLKALDASVVVPSFVKDRCVGFLVMGEKKSGTLYTTGDLEVFEVLGDQTALAIENAQFYEELQRTQTDLFQSQKMASLGHMAGGMSHQINNRFHVLSILAGAMKTVIQDFPDPSLLDPQRLREFWGKFKETFDKAEANALQGGDIVKTLLRFSRPGVFEEITVPQVVKMAKEVAQFRVPFKSIDYVEEIPEGLPTLWGSVNLLADSLQNLMANSYDAIETKQELILKKEMAPSDQDPTPYKGCLRLRVRVEEQDSKEWLVWEFGDTGVGMTPQDLECLFIPFFTTKATAEKGTGLGLYVIMRIIEKHGGTVTAASTYGVGTTFTIRLPVYIKGSPPPVPPDSDSGEGKPPSPDPSGRPPAQGPSHA